MRQRIITVTCLALLLCAGAMAQDDKAAVGHPLMESIERVFERSQSDDLKEYGLDNSLAVPPNLYNHSVKGCWLKKGESKINGL